MSFGQVDNGNVVASQQDAAVDSGALDEQELQPGFRTRPASPLGLEELSNRRSNSSSHVSPFRSSSDLLQNSMSLYHLPSTSACVPAGSSPSHSQSSNTARLAPECNESITTRPLPAMPPASKATQIGCFQEAENARG
ncbi:hypothetical protein K435DRAFT_852528 [Dendrothele bispora CBS 962.96]|uniref:Uncharacterized protein n=1 Tax=Dendrothele bispora (strain CBS 962.96) TaxID=1314807 RepID=A0A4S8MIU8_DENBC|nr:hypothetical protein K435DRAFT_852528 [Dendrothele bispora CBS 962.96]